MIPIDEILANNELPTTVLANTEEQLKIEANRRRQAEKDYCFEQLEAIRDREAAIDLEYKKARGEE